MTPNWDPAMSKGVIVELECVAIQDTCLDLSPGALTSRKLY
jgi:hypothetical protein